MGYGLPLRDPGGSSHSSQRARCMKFAIGVLVLLFLAGREPAPALANATQVSCPETCLPSMSEDTSQTISGACAMIWIAYGPATTGQATANCEATCSVCEQEATIFWACTGDCGQGNCTYIWEHPSYDRNRNAKPRQKGTGHGAGSVTVTVSSPCMSSSLPPVQGWPGVSVAGSRKVYKLSCGC